MSFSLTRRALRNTVLAFSLTALAGCSLFSNRNARYDPSPLTEYTAGVSANIAWSVSIGSDGGYGFAPVMVGDSVYAATPDGSVSKVDIASGRIQWRGDAQRE